MNYQIIAVREHPVWLNRAVDYFSAKWGIERKLYEDAVSDGITTANPLPRWFLLLKDKKIIGSCGLIENDFMVRKDLYPWLCALYIEETERGQGLGAKLLAHGRQEARKFGFDRVYLCTEHTGYYEKYGWSFFSLEESEWGGRTRVYEIASGV
ncbi:GCN5-related N-acetyltransferase [Syntrophobotulus glycolicus DSM 8271]|uniref:GCN5-related N-acetyltransferase n=1 Tax=Syntrophobotulus glycolicus (strain DSM 8271 / FlGlyR) TaxID=645991 RepID=F0T2G7_SYNGF|nr:GNAT family N-acetyltransferase [Syntrophobotulus glycolicus]ADY55285.1 GCN5-related N-acetyltransferase [Syntrophobotulus glycolicus DSM 8271]